MSLGRLKYDVPSGPDCHVFPFRVIVSRIFVNSPRFLAKEIVAFTSTRSACAAPPADTAEAAPTVRTTASALLPR